ncbi:aminodeoxychorismate synthase component I [Derxia gummosa]|uniref:Aminodeoxychorismate synthase component I n=1 Tax=Derxia gummosa DSM 723 TaxID=1121388 RepID=A0A8B6X3Z6_9BURK|nr:aminodeoxychorismate synthase component I [Derxia gummosa]
MNIFALLDDARATADDPTSRLYTGYVREHRCTDPATLDATWAAVAADQRDGLHSVLLADYEWGARLLGAGTQYLAPDDASSLRVLMFERLEHLAKPEVDAWLAAAEQRAEPVPAGILEPRASVNEAEFTAAIDRIHAAIRAGETYQVNYTYRIDFQAFGSPVALYRRLRARQPVAFGAFIGLPPGEATTHILSLSPELFVRKTGDRLTARPMKGTAARLVVPEADSEAARLLAEDVKNRAENLMIVDLLRNDIGRIAQTGSVKVPALFSIEPYSTVFQMTSTIEARLRDEVGMPELLRALFPCGSITGAPKHHTMGLIAEFESTRRGLYTGAIGWVDAAGPGAKVGDFCLSVAIRTLTLGAARAGLRPGRIGVGAGIVMDSVARDEWDECALKGSFLTALDSGLGLIETMAATPAGVMWLDRHLARLARSAAELGFACDLEAVRFAIDAKLREEFSKPALDDDDLDDGVPLPGAKRRLRLELSRDGRIALTCAPLADLPEGRPVRVLLAADPIDRADLFLRHKTTLRGRYDRAIRRAEVEDAFDMLFFDGEGFLTEGARSNVFVCLDGHWVTPPLDGGVLPGVMRSVLMDDPGLAAVERRIHRDELGRATAILVCNALRGALPAVIAQCAATKDEAIPTWQATRLH